MDEAISEQLDKLWGRAGAAAVSLQRVAEEQMAFAKNKLSGINNPELEAALWSRYEQALERVLAIGKQLDKAAQDAGILPKRSPPE